ncbi:MarC family protein [Gluconobacter morbifer]|uniref:UPF0056 membrane protein n=1 Tax=Gluconobacter morbifer G707 TaxID=1088869 RepID=G6XGK0_9PROT|nr:MarC family protein [Gluconobacter morbifer]EHH69308.1 hypothetical protein GMO_06150 [Gluconobacter morbifer G707]
MSLPPALGNVTTSWLIAFPALFSIINPLGASLIFAQITEGRARHEVLTLARLVALYSLGILLVSIWFGGWILGFFGISINALRITGGLVVASRAWVMLLQPETSEARKEKQAFQDGRTVATVDLKELAFFPVALPFTVGPGSISVAIALSTSSLPGVPLSDYFLGLSAAATMMAVIIAVVYAYAERVVAMLGVTGTRIVGRLAALLLLAIGIQILASGVEGFLIETLHKAKL